MKRENKISNLGLFAGLVAMVLMILLLAEGGISGESTTFYAKRGIAISLIGGYLLFMLFMVIDKLTYEKGNRSNMYLNTNRETITALLLSMIVMFLVTSLGVFVIVLMPVFIDGFSKVFYTIVENKGLAKEAGFTFKNVFEFGIVHGFMYPITLLLTISSVISTVYGLYDFILKKIDMPKEFMFAFKYSFIALMAIMSIAGSTNYVLDSGFTSDVVMTILSIAFKLICIHADVSIIKTVFKSLKTTVKQKKLQLILK